MPLKFLIYQLIVFIFAIAFSNKSFPQAYKLSGRYKISEGNVIVTVYLLVGKETKGNFQVKGNIGNMEQLVASILEETERWILK